jgi:hypothetical protein
MKRYLTTRERSNTSGLGIARQCQVLHVDNSPSVYRFQLKGNKYEQICQPNRHPFTRSYSHDSLVSVFTGASLKVSSTSVDEYGHEKGRVEERDRGVQTSRETPSEGLNPIGSVVLKRAGGRCQYERVGWGSVKTSSRLTGFRAQAHHPLVKSLLLYERIVLSRQLCRSYTTTTRIPSTSTHPCLV